MAASLGVSAPTCRTYLDALSGVFMVRQLQPWHENLGKRQVQAPKIYFRDSGLFHTLSHILSTDEPLTHPKLGASWEGSAIEEASRHHAPDEAYFWATHNHAELDLLLIINGKRIGIECKRADAPKLTPSMRIALGGTVGSWLLVTYRLGLWVAGQRGTFEENRAANFTATRYKVHRKSRLAAILAFSHTDLHLDIGSHPSSLVGDGDRDLHPAVFNGRRAGFDHQFRRSFLNLKNGD